MKSPVTSCFVIKKRGATYVTPPIVFFLNLNQDTVTKVLDMVPDLIDRFQKNKPAEENSEEVDSAVSDILSADE